MGAPRLLVIDDSPTIRKLVEIAFRGTNWQLTFTASGQDGIGQAGKLAPNVVLLDYMLPDVRGVEVCEALAMSAQTRHIPVIVMSAKSEEVRSLFKPFEAFVDCLPKPIAAELLVARVRQAAAAHAGRNAASRAPEAVPHELKEAVANALFSTMKAALAKVPAWCTQLGAAAPAAFFARKLFTPSAMEELVTALSAIFPETSTTKTTAPGLWGAPSDAAIAGRVTTWPMTDVLAFFGAAGRTGELALGQGDRETLAYWRSGEIVFVTTKDPIAYLAGAVLGLAAVPREALEDAQATQRLHGIPIHVTLFDRGLLPACDLAELLRARGRRLLLDAMDCRPVHFAWRDLDTLPMYVETYGRHVSVLRNTLTFGRDSHAQARNDDGAGGSLAQMTLERLRLSDATAVAHLLPSANATFDRVRGFSDKVKALELSSVERRVLASVNGRQTLSDIALEATVDLSEVLRVAHRLTEASLIQEVEGTMAGARAEGETLGKCGPVLILESDIDGFRDPLASHGI